MSVHSKEDVFQNLDNQLFAARFLPHPLAAAGSVSVLGNLYFGYQLVRDELLLDGNSRQNPATFCQTWVEPEIRKLMDERIDKNMIDKDETAEIESRFVHMLAHLWNSPDGANTQGCSTTGSRVYSVALTR